MNKKLMVSLIAGGVLGTTLFTYGFSNLTDKYTMPAHAEAIAKTDTTVTTVPNTAEGKAKIQNLMLNSIDYYKKASGSFEYLSTAGNFHLMVNYQTDVSDHPKSYEEVITLTPPVSTNVESPLSETKIYDGTTLELNRKYKDSKKDEQNSVKPNKISKSERDFLKNSTIKERVKKVDGEKAYINREDPSYLGISKTSLFPQDIAMGFLEDPTKWEISGTEEVAGLNTVVIKGTLNDYYTNKYKSQNFTLNVDPNTGILLQMKVTDSNGEIKQMIKTTTIKINGDLKDSLFTIQ